jgi:hypothetical protein
MKKKILLVFFVLSNVIVQAQITSEPLQFEDYYINILPSSSLKSASTTTYAPNGGTQTPHGDLRALIVFAGFGTSYDPNHDFTGWDSGPDVIPDFATNKQVFYNDYSDFTTYANVSNNLNLSKFYYIMSNKKFRFIAT